MMNRTIAILGVTGFLFASGNTGIGADDYRKLFQEVKPSVYLIQALDENRVPKSTGTGFAVTEDGLIVTNFHVIEGKTFFVVFDHEKKGNSQVSIYATDRRNDLALLRVSDTTTLPLALDEDSSIEEGQPVIVVGNPKGIHLVISDGIVSSANFEDQQSHFGITAEISPGSSGSPVMTPTGAVLGVATGQIVGGQNLNFSIRVSKLRRLLSDTNVDSDLIREAVDGVPEPPEKAEDPPPAPAKSEDKKSAPPEPLDKDFEDPSISEILSGISKGEEEKSIEKIDDTLEKSSGEKDYLLHFFKGIAFAQKDQRKESIESFEKCVELNPSFPQGFFNLAVQYLREERLEDARKTLEKALALKSDYASAWSNLGTVQHRLGKDADAIASYRQSLEHDAEDGEVWYNLGVLLDSPEEKIEAFQEAVRLQPEFALAQGELGHVLVASDEYEQAVTHLQKARDLGLDDAKYTVDLITALEKTGKKEEADALSAESKGGDVAFLNAKKAFDEKDYQAVVDALSGKLPLGHREEALSLMGYSQFQLGNLKESETAYRELVEIDPESRNAWVGLFQVLRKAGKTDEAAEAREKLRGLKE